MKKTSKVVSAAVLASLGLALAGCGGTEDMASTTPEKPSAQVAARADLLLKNPQLDPTSSAAGRPSVSALASDISYFAVYYVCVRDLDGVDHCENVSQAGETYYDWEGVVGVWTYEHGYASNYWSSFNDTPVYWDETQATYENGVMVGLWRHYTLQNVTSGNFYSKVLSTFNNAWWSDAVWIW